MSYKLKECYGEDCGHCGNQECDNFEYDDSDERMNAIIEMRERHEFEYYHYGE